MVFGLVTALIQMFDSWTEAFKEGKTSAVVMLDMSACFDVVDHEILLGKMKLYGLESCAFIFVEELPV